jgi:DNA-binding CsgD family transcriptional regulator
MPRPAKEKRNRKIVQRRRQGKSLREIGEEFQIRHTTVIEILEREAKRVKV